MKPIAVIILNWNGRSLLKKYLPSVVENTPEDIADVIIADNGSTDTSVEFIRMSFPQVKILEFDRNYGFAQGYNLAIERTRYNYTVLLNSDVRTPAGWLRPLYQAMQADSSLGACQPKILSDRHPDTFEYAGASGGFIDRNGYPYCRGRIFSTVEQDFGQYDTPMDIFWASGAAFMVQSSLYLELGGLDPEFFAHMEEIDLCWRIHLAGYRIKVIPAASVFHLGGGSLPAENPRKTYLNFRNNLLMLHKNLPVNALRRTLLRRRLLDTLAWTKYMLTFDIPNANAILKAHRDFRKMRRAYASHPSRNLLTEYRRPDILSEYFIHGHHTFPELG